MDYWWWVRTDGWEAVGIKRPAITGTAPGSKWWLLPLMFLSVAGNIESQKSSQRQFKLSWPVSACTVCACVQSNELRASLWGAPWCKQWCNHKRHWNASLGGCGIKSSITSDIHDITFCLTTRLNNIHKKMQLRGREGEAMNLRRPFKLMT